MTISTLPVTPAPGARLLEQHLVECPVCGQLGAAHVDGEGDASGRRALVRFVCPEGCAVSAPEVLAVTAGVATVGEVELTA